MPCTKNDVLKEFLTEGAELVGMYDFPQLKKTCSLIPKDVIPFSECLSCSEPEKYYVHFFIDDYKFERVWNNPKKYLPILKRFDGVISTDFSSYLNMSKSLQIYNRYRNRAMAYWMQSQGISVIPCVGWSDKESYNWCFDGLPKNSVLAVSTNGCFSKEGKESFIQGMNKMIDVLQPTDIIIVGRKIDLCINPNIHYYESFGQTMSRRLKNGR